MRGIFSSPSRKIVAHRENTSPNASTSASLVREVGSGEEANTMAKKKKAAKKK
jgi:hypothetical protein